MKLKQLLLTILLTTIILAACNNQAEISEESQEPTTNFVLYTDEELGVALNHPEDWVVHSGFGGLTVASSQEVIDGESLAEIGDNGFVLVIPGELGVFNMQLGQQFTEDDALQVLNVYIQLLEREGQTHLEIEPPQAFTIDGQSAASMVTRSQEDGKNLITIFAVVMNGDFMALVSAASLEFKADEMRPIFDEIIQSIHVLTPVGLQ
jgi:hypothetical protein